MKELDAPLENLLMIQNWEMLLTVEGQEALQSDLHMLEHWAISNHMKSNKVKYWVLHLGRCWIAGQVR